MNKVIYNNKELKQVISKVINDITDIVATTLGPAGNNVIIQGVDGIYYTTKDGVSVAKSVYSNNELENIIINLIKEVAIKTNTEVGDGTTTSLVIAQAAFNEAIKKIESGKSEVEIYNYFKDIIKDILFFIDEKSEKVDIHKNLKEIANISANGDELISSFVYDIFKKGNPNIGITIEPSLKNKSYITNVSGYSFSKTVSDVFLDVDTQKLVLKEPMCLFIDGKLLSIKPILTVLTEAIEKEKDLLILAEDFGEDVEQILYLNHINKNIKIAPVRTPGIRNEKSNILKDISVYLDGEIFKQTQPISKYTYADKVIITNVDTNIIKKDNKADRRINQLESKIKNIKDKYSIKKIKDRILKLQGETASIFIDGKSDLEIKERIDRVEDAVHATKSALLGGTIPGGGVALKDIANKYYKDTLMYNILLSPFKKITENSGITADVNLDYGFGYDVKNGNTIKYMRKVGIIDPTNVTKEGVKNALSIVAMLISSNGLILRNGNNYTN